MSRVSYVKLENQIPYDELHQLAVAYIKPSEEWLPSTSLWQFLTPRFFTEMVVLMWLKVGFTIPGLWYQWPSSALSGFCSSYII